ncbi:MAG: hypothetical protein ACREAX_04185 [Candidatus Nitrosotenuis sp.]
MLMLTAAALSIPQAQAERTDETRDIKPTPHRVKTVAIAIGAGAAVDIAGELHRSHYRFAFANSTSDDSDYKVKKGQMMIRDDRTRSFYKALPETWKINVSDDRNSFSATGQVVASSGKTFDVSLEGSKIRDVRDGQLYRVQGKFVGNGIEYELHYLSAIFKRSVPAETLPINVLDS